MPSVSLLGQRLSRNSGVDVFHIIIHNLFRCYSMFFGRDEHGRMVKNFSSAKANPDNITSQTAARAP